MYKLISPLLFRLPAETSHEIAIKLLHFISHHQLLINLTKRCYDDDSGAKINLMGLDFPNRIGLAAGFDKHALCINALSALGFGFIETGTVTPLPQAGNPKPRLFRLPEHQAIINRMGFNSVGLNEFITNYKKHRCNSIVGVNIGKNAITPLENALDDYLIGMQKSYEIADYIAVNLSSPNTQQLRELQKGQHFIDFIKAIKNQQAQLSDKHGKYTPLAIKIAPDLTCDEAQEIAHVCLQFKIDAIIATNTTIDRPMISDHPLSPENGGLSGRPLKEKATSIIRQLTSVLDGAIPIIGVGGISNKEDVLEKLDAGASLVQIYTAFIYKGPKLASLLKA